jgi:hypothetical protein
MSIRVLRTDSPSEFPNPSAQKLSQSDMPAINAGISRHAYYQDNIAYDRRDFGALEYSRIIDDWREVFDPVGSRWVSADNAAKRPPNDPA